MVERDKEFQVWGEQKMLKALSEFSGGELPGRSMVEEGKEEKKRKKAR